MASGQQHYVPQFLLKNFAVGRQPQVFAYDKETDREFRANVKNVAAESGFYDLSLPPGDVSIEPELAILETKVSEIVNTLIRNRSLRELNDEQKHIFALFMAVQFVRTKEHRLRFEFMRSTMEDKLRRMGANKQQLDYFNKLPFDVSAGKLLGIKSVLGAHQLQPCFLNKEWVIFQTTPMQPLYISDNPVVLQNELDYGPYGNLGLAVKGIEIYLPLSTTLCLGLLCPTIAKRFQEGYWVMKTLDKLNPSLLNTMISNAEETRQFLNGWSNGTPIALSQENVMRLNCLQVIYSSRFVYCQTNDFALVSKMINDNPKFRRGLKPTVS